MEKLNRAVEFEIQERSAEDRTIVGLITTDAVDRYREVVDPSGAMLENYRKNPVVLLNHNSWSTPIGKNLWIKPSENGLVAKTQFADTTEGHDIYALYDQGIMRAWSIGFIPKKWEDGDVAVTGYRRKFTLWELLEYSAVTIPANPEALSNALQCIESRSLRETIEAQSAEIKTAQDIDQLFLMVKEQSQEMEAVRELLQKIENRLLIQERVLTTEPVETPHVHTAPQPEMPATSAAPQKVTTSASIERMIVEVLGRKLGG